MHIRTFAFIPILFLSFCFWGNAYGQIGSDNKDQEREKAEVQHAALRPIFENLSLSQLSKFCDEHDYPDPTLRHIKSKRTNGLYFCSPAQAFLFTRKTENSIIVATSPSAEEDISRIVFKLAFLTKTNPDVAGQEERFSNAKSEMNIILKDLFKNEELTKRIIDLVEKAAFAKKGLKHANGAFLTTHEFAVPGITTEIKGAAKPSSAEIIVTLSPMVERHWIDSTGKNETLAYYVSQSSKAAILLKHNGKELTVPLKKLSDDDQKWLKELRMAEKAIEDKKEAKKNRRKNLRRNR